MAEDNSKKKYWFLVPTQVLDKTKYRGKGRPRKSDYRKYPGPQDFIKFDPWPVTFTMKEMKGDKYQYIVSSRGIS